MEENNEVKDLKKRCEKAKLIIILSSFLSVLIIGIIYYGFYFVGNSKSVLIQSFGKFSNSATKMLDEVSESEYLKNFANSKKVLSKGNLTIDGAFGNYSFNYNAVSDSQKQIGVFDFDFLQDNKELIGTKIVSSNNKIYFKLKKFMDMYYYISSEYVDNPEIADIDYEKMIDVFVKNVKNGINEKDIVKGKETISINGKDVNTTKLTYTFTNERLNKIAVMILEDFRKDDLLSELSKVVDISSEELGKKIDSWIKEIKDSKENGKEELFDYSVYYRGINNIVKYKVSDDKVEFSCVCDGDFSEFNFVLVDDNGETKFNLKLDKDGDKENIDGELIFSGVILKLKGYYQDSKGVDKFKFTLSMAGEDFTIDGERKLIEKELNKYEVNAKFLFGDEELFNINFVSEISYNADISMSVDDIKNSKDVKGVTDEEILEIYNKLLEDANISKFLETIIGNFSA